MTRQTDPRIVRTTHALEQAIVELAVQRPVSQITVADLAELAGITRATFYNRFNSPLELLIHVLNADLEAGERLKEARRADGEHTARQVLRLTITDVADHVERFLPVYQHALHDPADEGVYGALVRCFIARSMAVITRSAPPALPRATHPIMAELFAHGFTGAIKGWLSDGSVTKADLIEAAVACAPDWWN
jgi:AcrR family transcriptional regulator